MPPIRGYSSPCMSFVPFGTIRHAKGYHFYSSRVSKRSMMFHVVSHKFQHALRMYLGKTAITCATTAHPTMDTSKSALKDVPPRTVCTITVLNSLIY